MKYIWGGFLQLFFQSDDLNESACRIEGDERLRAIPVQRCRRLFGRPQHELGPRDCFGPVLVVINWM